MVFEEYKKLFEEILALTAKIEELCINFKSDETDELFHKRNALMKKLSVPEDLDDEKFAQIIKIKNEVAKRNENILKAMQKEKNKVESDLKEIRATAPQLNSSDSGQIEQTSKSKTKPGDSSIFS
ncbi:MAG: hypothetical protein K6A44_03070 [bacterium]|nr:hypothetical protein [bacterium]